MVWQFVFNYFSLKIREVKFQVQKILASHTDCVKGENLTLAVRIFQFVNPKPNCDIGLDLQILSLCKPLSV